MKRAEVISYVVAAVFATWVVSFMTTISQVKVGTYNPDAVIKDSPELLAIVTKYNAKKAEIQNSLVGKSQEIQTLKTKLADYAKDNAPKETLDRIQGEIKQKQDFLDTQIAESQRELASFEQQNLPPVNTAVSEAVAKVGEDKGLTLVLAAGSVVYAKKSVDITESVSAEIAKKKKSTDKK